MKVFRVSVLLFVLVILAGCYSTRFYASEGEYTMNPDKKGKVVGQVEESIAVPFFVYGLAGSGDVDISQVCLREKVANMKINYKTSFVDMLLSGLTFGIYTPKTAIIRGDRVE